MKPTRIELINDTLAVVWDDGHESYYECEPLRRQCPCAVCQGETNVLSATPPALRIATIDRIRCWFIPMRPVTPFMMMPSRCCAMYLFPCQSVSRLTVPLQGEVKRAYAPSDRPQSIPSRW